MESSISINEKIKKYLDEPYLDLLKVTNIAINIHRVQINQLLNQLLKQYNSEDISKDKAELFNNLTKELDEPLIDYEGLEKLPDSLKNLSKDLKILLNEELEKYSKLPENFTNPLEQERKTCLSNLDQHLKNKFINKIDDYLLKCQSMEDLITLSRNFIEELKKDLIALSESNSQGDQKTIDYNLNNLLQYLLRFFEDCKKQQIKLIDKDLINFNNVKNLLRENLEKSLIKLYKIIGIIGIHYHLIEINEKYNLYIDSITPNKCTQTIIEIYKLIKDIEKCSDNEDKTLIKTLENIINNLRYIIYQCRIYMIILKKSDELKYRNMTTEESCDLCNLYSL